MRSNAVLTMRSNAVLIMRSNVIMTISQIIMVCGGGGGIIPENLAFWRCFRDGSARAGSPAARRPPAAGRLARRGGPPGRPVAAAAGGAAGGAEGGPRFGLEKRAKWPRKWGPFPLSHENAAFII